MNTGIDSPSGRVDTIPSSLTGGILRYFTPYPLTELLDRAKAFEPGIASIETASSSSLPILISSAMSLRGGQLDQRQLAVFLDMALGNTQVQSLRDLLALGGRLGVRVPEIRREIVYADAPIPSKASIIFAHYEAVPALMDSVVSEINRSAYKIDPYTKAVVTGFFCAQMHPFLDGNGRWSRAVAAATGIASGAMADSYLAALFLSTCKDDLAQVVWAKTRMYGLRDYLERAFLFREAFLQEMPEAVIADTEKVLSAVSVFSKTKRSRHDLLAAIFSNRGIDAESVRKFCNVSSRVADGRIQELLWIATTYSNDDPRTSIRVPWRSVLIAGVHAKRAAMEGVR